VIKAGIFSKYKLAVIVLLCVLASLNQLYPQEKAKSTYFVLDNGLKVYLVEKQTLPLVNVAIGFNVGSKDESEETNGLVHILEHYILFRGTELRSGREIIQDIRQHGAYFNAHTGYDIALFELVLPSEHINFAIENQRDILFNLKITQEKLDEEKQIILEELNRLQDNPIQYATSLAYQNLFNNHPYQRPIPGKKEIIETATAEQLEKFYREYFVTNNCILAIVGDFKAEELEDKIRDTFGDLEKGQAIPAEFEMIPDLEKSVQIEKEMDVNLAYLVIGMIGPDYNHTDQYTANVLIEVLGRGINPMLNQTLRERTNLVYTITSGYSALRYGGAILIYFTLDPKNIGTVKRKATDFLRETRRLNYSKKDHFGESQFYAFDFLESAKSQIKFKSHQAREKGLDIASSLVLHSFLNTNKSRRSYLDTIDEISSSDLRKAAGEFISKGRYVMVTIVPNKKK